MKFNKRAPKRSTGTPTGKGGARTLGLPAFGAAQLNALKFIQPTPSPIRITTFPVKAKVSSSRPTPPIVFPKAAPPPFRSRR